MKRFKNKLFATALLLTTMLAFSSCEDDYEWDRAVLNFTTEKDKYPPSTNTKGEFSLTIDFYDSDIKGSYSHSNRIGDFRMYNSWLTIFNKQSFREGDEIDVYFESDGVGRYEVTLVVDFDGYAYVDGSRDKALLNFMGNFIDKLLSRGNSRLYIYGEVYDYRGDPVTLPLDFDLVLENSFDIEVRR